MNKITGRHVSLRYPSMYSLRSYFDLNRTKPDNKKQKKKSLLPVLDEGYVARAELAGELLYRRIPHHQVSLNRDTWRFWVSPDPQPDDATLYRPISPDGKCWSELRSRGMIKWGKRLRVRYESRHNKKSARLKEEDDDGTGKRKLITESRTESQIVVYKKRKTGDVIESRDQRLAHVSEQKKENQIVVYKRRSEKNFIDRWSVER